MAGDYPQEKFVNASLQPGSYWERWQSVARNVTIPIQLDLLRKTGRYDAFNLKHIPYYDKPPSIWPVPDHLFWESDVAKWIEGACYHLQNNPDAEIQSHVEYLVDLIEKAQQPDGYLNIHFVANEPEKRWSSLRDLHELYNFGHLIEAALAYHAQTGSDKLNKVMLRFVDYCCTVFGTEAGKLAGYPGHPEVELALLRLYRRTAHADCLRLATYFLTERGRNGGQYYNDEQARRGEHPHTIPSMMPKPYSFWYMQAHKPIAEQDTIEGHSVRAMYLLTAVQDLVVSPDSTRFTTEHQVKELAAAARTLWNSMVRTKMYVTGGIGSIKQWEGFGIPYSLPISTDEGGCYTETCAGIGLLMLADRLLHEKLDVNVADVAERVLFNSSITTGMSVNGKSFTYVNQLASSHEEPCQRFDWFECACCPPNVMRTFGCLQGYFFGTLVARPSDLAIHQIFAGNIDYLGNRVQIQTDYPLDGSVKLKVDKIAPSATIWLRIPGWAQSDYQFSGDAKFTNGYLAITQPGDFQLQLNLTPRILHSHPDVGPSRITLAYGPLIYCIEDVDNAWINELPDREQHFKHLCVQLPSDAMQIRVNKPDEAGIIKLTLPKAGYTLKVQDEDGFASAFEQNRQPGYYEQQGQGRDLVFVPYYYRCNRAETLGRMRTSLRVKAL
ncbi:hypothetical protein PHSY_004152 [Pseudozyma hubeiensis SY62]|uniref:DUF1680 domain protein n=1 Tax=Pseudozyma hubeiensis (strain SY62) TaxID=1305764 RepID=R9P5D2_PSEHS|nr:hypothetical protein PHSY_004152 [Pseudozyma hubeiensis SY62]GAC96571.1 hypothetical protein PHSY_004152 [Pseudozyma hubeiensis SY62]